jgi:peptide/nickel transport system substrate-binding protein
MDGASNKKIPPALFLTASLFVIVLLAVAACGGGAQPTPTTGAAATATSATGATAVPGETPTAGQTPPSTGPKGTLRVAVEPIGQTDPAYISSDSEVLIANHVYDYLIDIDADNNIQPRLATTWTISADGRTYVFSLARGVTFHDGSPFGAKDVVWTYNRLRDPKLGLPTQNLYKEITNVEATGDLTVTFTLSETNPFFLYDLSDNHALMLKADTQNPGKDFNGTGPFVVTNYQPADRIDMTAFKDYWVPGEPKLENLQIIFFSDESAAADALRGGQVDLDFMVSTPQYINLQQVSNLNTVDVKTNQFDVIRLRTDQPPGNDPRVVQALKLATDREALLQLVQQGYGAVGHDTPIGPMYTKYYTSTPAPPPQDIAAAKKLLASAGYTDGLNLDLYYPNVLNHGALASALKAQWQPAGINVNLVSEPESVYYGGSKWLEVKFGITGWGSRPYPQFYLDVMLTCNAIWNETRFCDPQFDQLVNVAGTTMDEQSRIQTYYEIQKILVEKGPLIVPYFWARFAAINDQFGGFQLKAFPGRSDLRVVYLKQ